MSRSLPVNPSVRFLQVEAKSILKAHKNGDAGICATYRLMKRFTGSSDQDILQADVSLQETQYALALDYSFEDWKALKTHVEAMQSASEAPEGEGHREPPDTAEEDDTEGVSSSVEREVDSVVIVGPDLMQNQLLVSYLQKETGLDCRQCSPSLPAEGLATRSDRKALFLIDAKSPDLVDTLRRFDADSPTFNANHLAAVYNLDRDAGIAGELLQYNLRGLFFDDDPLSDLSRGIEAIIRGHFWDPESTRLPDESIEGSGVGSILVVDPDPEISRILREHLDGHDESEYAWTSATDVEAARKCLAGQAFDLVLCDLEAPGEPMTNLIEHIASEYEDTAVIAVMSATGHIESVGAISAMGLRAFDFVTKPFMVRELGVRIQNLSRVKRSAIANRA